MERVDYETVVNGFLNEMIKEGLNPGNIQLIADGKFHRFTAPGDSKGSNAGWYVLHLDDFPMGSFGSWKEGTKYNWRQNKFDKKLSPSERKELEEKWAAQEKKRNEEEKIIHEESSKRAKEIWDNSSQNKEHPYLTRKGIKIHGARISKDDDLIIPLRNSKGELTSIQVIKNTGEKKFLQGGKIEGSYFSIYEKKPNEADTICICEGFATGASIFQATGFTTVIAFNTSNLKSVSKIIRQKFPKNKIIFCADNDQWSKTKSVENPGIHYATKAAADINGIVVYPEFKDVQTKPTDFNDLANQEGLNRVAEIIESVIKETPPEENSTSKELEAVQVVQKNEYKFSHIIMDWPYQTGKGKPIPCIENVHHLLKCNNITVRYDVIKKDILINIPHEEYLIDTERNDKMNRLLSIASTAGLPITKMEDYVSHIATQHKFNPVIEWIFSKPWDGVSRLNDFFNTVTAVGDDEPIKKTFKETIIKRWMLSAIAAAFGPNGVSARGVLVFTGNQSVGKTNWFKHLVPQSLKLTKDGCLLDPKDKDSVYQVVSNWIVELGEVDATFRKADIAQLKAFITKNEDTIRLPFRRDPNSFARRTVFYASVNDREYLSDSTGNTRFWTIEVTALDHSHKVDMQQVWSEVYESYKKGESWYLNPEESNFLNNHNQDYETAIPIDELIATSYDWDTSAPVRSVRNLTATEVAKELDYKNPTIKETKAIATALRKLKIQSFKSMGYTKYKMPNLKSAFNGF